MRWQPSFTFFFLVEFLVSNSRVGTTLGVSREVTHIGKKREQQRNMSYANIPREISIPHTPSMIRNNLNFDRENQIVRRIIVTPVSMTTCETNKKKTGNMLWGCRTGHEKP